MKKELKDAIRHIKTRADGWAVAEIISALEQLNIVGCDQCVKANKDGTCDSVCDDAISRKAIKQRLQDHRDLFINTYGENINRVHENDKARVDEIDNCIAEVINMPSVTPSRCKGRWLDYRDDGFVECPFCGHATNCEDDIDELHYCFWCGAEMESSDDSN